MSYFEFYTKANVNKPDEMKVSTIPQNVPSQPEKTTKNSKTTEIASSARKHTNKSKTNSAGAPESTERIKGTCLSMCPEDEVKMRIQAKMVHILEVIDSKRVLVKCYSRSAADSLVAVPCLLRPYKVLRDTVQYLMLKITQRETSAGVIYDFVTDRLRAVRQDMTVQRLSATECVTLLEPMIRFHVYFGYKLCEHPINVYDPVLNKKLLLECLKWYLSCCDSMDQSTAGDLAREISQLNLNHNHKTENALSRSFLSEDNDIKCDQVLMESLYILCNLDDVHPMYRYWNMSKILRSNTTIKVAYQIAVANLRGNYIQVCKLLEHLCPLTYCALCLHLPTLRRHAFQVMSAAYNSKQLTVTLSAIGRWLRFDSDEEAARVCAHYGLLANGGALRFSRGDFKGDAAILTEPLSAIRRWLRFDSDEEAARVCAHYGLLANGGALRFSRGDFKGDAAIHQPTRLLLLDQKMDLSVPHVFTYVSSDYDYGV